MEAYIKLYEECCRYNAVDPPLHGGKEVSEAKKL